MSGFSIGPRDKGFHITFENGYTVSVQFGWGNYCANRDDETNKKDSPNAEIAAWDKDHKWYRPDGWVDDVSGWRTPAEVLAFMVEVAAL